MSISRRNFLSGSAACAVAAVLPAAAEISIEVIEPQVFSASAIKARYLSSSIWVDVPGTDMAIAGPPHIVSGWFRVFEVGRGSMSEEAMRELLIGPWEYIVSPNYKGPESTDHLPTLEKWMAENGNP